MHPTANHLKKLVLNIFVLFFLAPVSLTANKLEKGFEALSIYDYFKAKKIFTQINAKQANAFSCYGLATIFSRNDNPFSDIDSAAKYVNLGYHLYLANGNRLQTFGFTVDAPTLLELADTVSAKQFRRAKKVNTVLAYDRFLQNNYLGNKELLRLARYLRDELEFNRVLQLNHSDSTQFYLLTHPLGNFIQEAQQLLDRQYYEETTRHKRAKDYIVFLKKYPKNAFVGSAYERLFSIYKQQSDVNGLSYFVENYPNAPQNLEAWKLLFSLTAKVFSFAELKKFLYDHPNFPLKNSILKELELNKLTMYPYQQQDYTGFINEQGKFVIAPLYDAATNFCEGLSVVNKNDSVFFINKENINPFGRVFNDAHVFKDGMAPVKIHSKWAFINRLGQLGTKQYDEINELSDDIYVVKLDGRYGALDRFGQIVVEPKYDKLGDFKNDLAYYIEKGIYGFVSKTGAQHKAEFEWISDFSEYGIAVIRKNNKYGLINSDGKKILEPEYDQVLRTNSEVFLVVNNNLYGFFHLKGCFLTTLSYDYVKEKPVDFYTNGSWFKLLKKGEQALVDENGATILNYGAYAELDLPSDGLIRVKRKRKYAYLDKKLQAAIPFKYDEAENFSDSLALVKEKDRFVLINTSGVEVYATNLPIEKISSNYYLIQNEPKILIDKRGNVIHLNVAGIQKINEQLMALSLNNGEIKLLNY